MNNKITFFVLLVACSATAVAATLWHTYHLNQVITAPIVAACISIAQMLVAAGLLVNQARQGKISPWYAINVILSVAGALALLACL